MAIELKDLMEAFDYVSGDPGLGNAAYLDKETGRIYWCSEFGDGPDELPEDIEDEKYIEVPDKNELDLGRRVAISFSRFYLPEMVEKVENIFARKGAYSRFKELLGKQGLIDKWYQFESETQEKALREWCEESGIEVQG